MKIEEKHPKPINIDDITLEVIEEWVLKNRKDMDLMDDINTMTYHYTSKYANQVTRDKNRY